MRLCAAGDRVKRSDYIKELILITVISDLKRQRVTNKKFNHVERESIERTDLNILEPGLNCFRHRDWVTEQGRRKHLTLRVGGGTTL